MLLHLIVLYHIHNDAILFCNHLIQEHELIKKNI